MSGFYIFLIKSHINSYKVSKSIPKILNTLNKRSLQYRIHLNFLRFLSIKLTLKLLVVLVFIPTIFYLGNGFDFVG